MVESIFDYEEENRANGYGVAFIDPNGRILTPYIDPSDYPDLEVQTSQTSPNGKGIGKYEGYLLLLHSGVAEDWYSRDINYYTEQPNGQKTLQSPR